MLGVRLPRDPRQLGAEQPQLGLAVDLNSLANPMGSRLVTDMPRWMPKLWTGHGFAWGGAYTGRKDAMHYEYVGTPAELRRTIAALPVTDRHAARDDRGTGRAEHSFPLPRGHWFGVADGTARCHDGRADVDSPSWSPCSAGWPRTARPLAGTVPTAGSGTAPNGRCARSSGRPA